VKAMPIAYRPIDENSQTWLSEEQLCSTTMECWVFEKQHQIAGFEFDEREDISPVFAWFLYSLPTYRPTVSSVWEKEDMFCLEGEDVYACYLDEDSTIVGAKYDDRSGDILYVSVFDVRNLLHLKAGIQ